jgi:hypothetical protein
LLRLPLPVLLALIVLLAGLAVFCFQLQQWRRPLLQADAPATDARHPAPALESS